MFYHMPVTTSNTIIQILNIYNWLVLRNTYIYNNYLCLALIFSTDYLSVIAWWYKNVFWLDKLEKQTEQQNTTGMWIIGPVCKYPHTWKSNGILCRVSRCTTLGPPSCWMVQHHRGPKVVHGYAECANNLACIILYIIIWKVMHDLKTTTATYQLYSD